MDKKRYQLSQSELGIYTACQTHQGLEYNLPFVVEIPFIGINKVREILDNILSKHSSLYTRFCLDNEYGVAKYQEPFDYEIEEIDYPKDLEKLVTYFDINDWLESRYIMLMQKYAKDSRFDGTTEIDKPFWHLESDAFWHLNYPGERLNKSHTPSKAWLKNNVEFAYFDESLWILLQNRVWRTKLRDYIIEHKLTDDFWSSKTAAEGLGVLAALLLAS